MLLRRIASALNRQDWATVIIELVLVIAGVLIALQVDNWNDSRENRVLERQYLGRLLDDLNGTIQDHNQTMEWNQTRLEQQQLVLDSLRAGTLEIGREDEFETGLAWVGRINPLRRRWGAVEELNSTGNISLILDLELRSGISSLGAVYERSEKIVERETASIFFKRSQLTSHYQIRAVDVLGPARADVVYDFEVLVQDSEFINTFSDLQTTSHAIVSLSHVAMEAVERFRDDLAVWLDATDSDFPRLQKRSTGPWELRSEDVSP